MTQGITFCSNWNCTKKKCPRNPKNIKLNIPHRFDNLEGTETWCKKPK